MSNKYGSCNCCGNCYNLYSIVLGQDIYSNYYNNEKWTFNQNDILYFSINNTSIVPSSGNFVDCFSYYNNEENKIISLQSTKNNTFETKHYGEFFIPEDVIPQKFGLIFGYVNDENYWKIQISDINLEIYPISGQYFLDGGYRTDIGEEKVYKAYLSLIHHLSGNDILKDSENFVIYKRYSSFAIGNPNTSYRHEIYNNGTIYNGDQSSFEETFLTKNININIGVSLHQDGNGTNILTAYALKNQNDTINNEYYSIVKTFDNLDFSFTKRGYYLTSGSYCSNIYSNNGYSRDLNLNIYGDTDLFSFDGSGWIVSGDCKQHSFCFKGVE